MGLPVLTPARTVSGLPTREDGKYDLAKVVVQPGDILRIKNLDSATYEFMYNSIPYRVPANGEASLPFEAAALWFGDPRSGGAIASTKDRQGLTGWVPDRDTEVRRLRVKYGIVGGTETSFPEEQIPHVELYDIDGNRVMHALDDPTGENVNVAVPTQAQQADLQSQVANLTKQVEALLAGSATAQAAADDAPVAPEPSPELEPEQEPSASPPTIPAASVSSVQVFTPDTDAGTLDATVDATGGALPTDQN
jgi:hypothetical protein